MHPCKDAINSIDGWTQKGCTHPARGSAALGSTVRLRVHVALRLIRYVGMQAQHMVACVMCFIG